jgi:hypothetical protein
MFRLIVCCIVVALIVAVPILVQGQKYNYFEIENNDLYWRYTYEYTGSNDSLRREVVQMLKSKFFTFSVTRNEAGYNGEINHYKVDCKKYDRTYFNMPRMYSEGEWTGKFIVDVFDNHYQVIIFALYFEKFERSSGYYRTERAVKGRYIDAVTKKNRTIFKRNEFANLDLMSLSLKDNFDIKNVFLSR